MRVKLIHHTDSPEEVCARAARGDMDLRPSYEIEDYKHGGWEKILDHCFEHGHLGVFEHASFTFSISGISRVCSHQLVRHRIATYDQQSQRYVDLTQHLDKEKPCYNPLLEKVLEYYRGEEVEDLDLDPVEVLGEFFVIPPKLGEKETSIVCQAYAKSFLAYVELVRMGVPVEDARMGLPGGIKTNITATFNYRALYEASEKRLCTRSQWEIREVFKLMKKEVEKVSPFLAGKLQPKCVHLGYCDEPIKDWEKCKIRPHHSQILKK